MMNIDIESVKIIGRNMEDNEKIEIVMDKERFLQWESKLKSEAMHGKLLCELDGNDLCIKKEDFINLQESPAIFIELTEKQIEEFNRFALVSGDEQ